MKKRYTYQRSLQKANTPNAMTSLWALDLMIHQDLSSEVVLELDPAARLRPNKPTLSSILQLPAAGI